MTDAAAIRCLQKRYRAPAMVQLGTPEDTLIATLLTARTRDEQVLKVYPSFRKRFPTLQSLADATPTQIARSIASIGPFRNKSRAIHALAKKLLAEFGGIVPNTMDELTQLPGVGRKTASCVLWYGFGIPAVAVDVHVFRIAHRLGWAIGETPEDVETELRARLPRKYWGECNRVCVQFGRELCKPQRPQCAICPLREMCPFGRRGAKR